MLQEKIISLKNINKNYGKKQVLQNFNLDIYEGDRIAYLGGNGSGKSTTVEIIANVIKQTSGEIWRKPGLVIGIQFQESNYPTGITPENLMAFYLNKFNGGSINAPRIKEMIKIFRLQNLMKKNINGMSGGQKQRINILLALVHNPNFLILDELSTGLDIKIRREIRKYVYDYLEANPKCSLILVTHNINEALKICNRVIFLESGKIVTDSKIETLIKKHGSLEKYADQIFDKIYATQEQEEQKTLKFSWRKFLKKKGENDVSDF